MKFLSIKKGIVKGICLALCIGVCAYGVLVSPSNVCGVKKGDKTSAPIILNLWHLDTFEGGTGSRKQFLLSVAREFEKQNDGVLISVREHTKNSLESQTQLPDILSYGVGVTPKNASKLTVDKGFSSGEINGETYALPWARGGYFLLSFSEIAGKVNFDTVTVSEGDFNTPQLAFYTAGFTAKKLVVKKPVDAYSDFITGQAKVLLGTQRDLNRLMQKGLAVYSLPIEEYSDLYQYISVTTTSQIKKSYAEKFINYLTSKSVQESLTKIGMYSPYYQKIYADGLIAVGQDIKPKYTLHAFTEYSVLVGVKKNFSGVEDFRAHEINIKKLLINLDKFSLI